MNLDTPCKIWTGATEKTGYGRRKVKGRMWMAHRFAYQEHYGDLDPDMVVDHICFNRACVEPTHLRQITLEENSVRHNPDCGCVSCSPELHILDQCGRGHDISTPDGRTAPSAWHPRGQCLACSRNRKREYSRAYRARLATAA